MSDDNIFEHRQDSIFADSNGSESPQSEHADSEQAPREKTYMELLSDKERVEQQLRVAKKRQYLDIGEIARKEKADSIAIGEPMSEKQWEQVKREDFVFYMTPRAQQLRKEHRETMGVLYFA